MSVPATSPVRRRLQWAVRIRSKMIVLHTAFSLALAVLLLAVMQGPIREVLRRSGDRECRLALAAYGPDGDAPDMPVDGVRVESWVEGESAGLPDLGRLLGERPSGEVVSFTTVQGHAGAAMRTPDGRVIAATAESPVARAIIGKLYLILMLALLGIYGVIAVIMEVFVLPRHVYSPIERVRRADAAVQSGVRDAELIPEEQIPDDELGDIMRSRNATVVKLRQQEEELERIASELRRKNHLLETARRNMADQDRLVSLGMMSAGIAHELNTPLAVLKGTVEQLAKSDHPSDERTRIELIRRVVARLERLGESLLDFARVRPPLTDRVEVAPLLEECWTLVRLDRGARGIEFRSEVPRGVAVSGDPDRLAQVFVNLIRNASDAMDGRGMIGVTTEPSVRDGRSWVSVIIRDSGPGIAPDVLPRLFEPFASTRLDANGTGLGLAVAEGIVKEHGGVILARNAPLPERGAVFEVMLPAAQSEPETSSGSKGQVEAFGTR